MWARLQEVKAAAAEREARSPKKSKSRSLGPRMLKLLDAVGVPEDLPEAPTPSSLKCQPKPYQLQA